MRKEWNNLTIVDERPEFSVMLRRLRRDGIPESRLRSGFMRRDRASVSHCFFVLYPGGLLSSFRKGKGIGVQTRRFERLTLPDVDLDQAEEISRSSIPRVNEILGNVLAELIEKHKVGGPGDPAIAESEYREALDSLGKAARLLPKGREYQAAVVLSIKDGKCRLVKGGKNE
jgi:hypothetical protein